MARGARALKEVGTVAEGIGNGNPMQQPLRELLEQRLGDLQEQLDRRVAIQQRELVQSVEHLESEIGDLKEYFERVFEEKSQALEVATVEREKSAAALRTQQDKALDQAERERQKSAEALALSLDRAMKEGDDRLREHISNQVQQIRAALESAEKLEVERMEQVKVATEYVKREAAASQDAGQKAIEKAETATEKRFEAVNEFREQLNDQAGRFLPRETFESVIEGLTVWRQSVDTRLDNQAGREQREASFQPVALAIAASVVTVVVTVVVIVVNVLTG